MLIIKLQKYKIISTQEVKMKNYTLFTLLAGTYFLVSCGTYNKASNSQAYQNGIYYNYDENAARSTSYSNQAEATGLQAKTYRALNESNTTSTASRRDQVSSSSSNGTQTIYVGDTNQVNIQYDPNVTYSIMDDDESYEARLKKFDSPTYTVNISFGGFWEDPWYSPWWGGYYDRWYRPNWITWGTGWYNPYYGYYYSWMGPRWNIGYSWYNGWYAGVYGWNDPWYGGWYGGWYDPWYYGGIYNPWYHDHHWGHNGGWYPGNRRGRDVYYGKRESYPSYNNMGNGYRPQNGGQYGSNASMGSVTRRPQMNTVRDKNGYNNGIYSGNNIRDERPNSNAPVRGNTTYTRGGNTTGNQGNQSNGNIYNGTGQNNGNVQGQGSYTRSGSTYNRGGNNQQNNKGQQTYNGVRYTPANDISNGNGQYKSNPQSTYRRASNPVPSQSQYGTQGQSVTNRPANQNSNSNRSSYNNNSSYSRSSSSNSSQSYSRSSNSSGSSSSGSSSSGSGSSGGGSTYRR